MAKPLVIFLMGPTASGKTDLAIALHQRLPVDVISVDSALVYRDMNIGSAKPSAAEQALAPHQLLDIRDPADPYSVADFCIDARAAIAASVAAGRIPLLVGGTIMYFKALLEGMAEMPGADPAVRAAIEAEAELKGWPAIHAQLAAVDPQTAAGIHPNHSQRLSRALEVYRVSGKTMTELRAAQVREDGDLRNHYNVVQFALLPHNRALLHERIAQRFEQMLELGFVAEVEALRARGDLHKDLPAIRAVGYRQVWEYLDGDYSVGGSALGSTKTDRGESDVSGGDYAEMVSRGVAATRQLAKRQLTWLRGWPERYPELHTLYIDTESGQIRKKEQLLLELLNFLPQVPL